MMEEEFEGVLILTIALNEESNITRCVESVRAQHSQNWRQVVGDNLSNDETRDKVLSIGDERVKLLAWNSRTGSTQNFIRTAAAALEIFPRAKYVLTLNGDDYLKSSEILTIDTVKTSTETVVVPVFENEDGTKIGPNFKGTALVNSHFRILRSIPLSRWVWADVILGRHPRQSFERLLWCFENSMRGTAEDDWRATTLYFLTAKCHVTTSQERIVRRSRSSEVDYHQFHSQDNHDSTIRRNNHVDPYRIEWAVEELRKEPNANAKFRFWISLVVVRILIGGLVSKSKQIIIDICKRLFDWFLRPLGLKLRRNASSRKLELRSWSE
jgi:glycosyltransferase involved in cell wall biosynthesis